MSDVFGMSLCFQQKRGAKPLEKTLKFRQYDEVYGEFAELRLCLRVAMV